MRHVGVHTRTAGSLAEQQTLSRNNNVMVHAVQAPLRTDLAAALAQVPADETRLADLAQRFGPSLQRPQALNVAQLAEIQPTFELANMATFLATGTRGRLSLPRLVAALREVIEQRAQTDAPDVASLMLLAVWRALGVPAAIPETESEDDEE
jgi:hypothetical protein